MAPGKFREPGMGRLREVRAEWVRDARMAGWPYPSAKLRLFYEFCKGREKEMPGSGESGISMGLFFSL